MAGTHGRSLTHSLAGDRQGQHSIRINKQWRLCFVFGKGGAEEVEISKHYE
jgi:proteic killer suppression protein